MRTTSIMALPSSILAGLLLFSLTSAQTDNGNECSCFRTNGSSAGYFTYHRFFDYRNVAGASATPPAVISNENNATEAFATSDFFLNDAWTNDWTIQNWNNSDGMSSTDATVLMINSPNNVYIGTSPSSTSNSLAHDVLQKKVTTPPPITHPTSPSAPRGSPGSNPPPKSTPTKRTSNTSLPAS
jgi:hypothetical protein